jgi:RimJ/RimL family protein N-acetyltransferase
MEIRPVTLSGTIVRLEPLSLEHVSGLVAIGLEESIWRYMLYGRKKSEADLRAWVEDMLRRQAAGADLPFAVRHQKSGRLAGATRYLEIRPEHRTLEIGGTWYGLDFQRTAVNTESKYLLIRHAFEKLGAVRVQFKTDLRNLASQKAIERLGAVKEGILRQHMITPEGVLRDSIYYSIIDAEWPRVKARLEEMLERKT